MTLRPYLYIAIIPEQAPKIVLAESLTGAIKKLKDNGFMGNEIERLNVRELPEIVEGVYECLLLT